MGIQNDFLKGKRILIAEDDFVNQKLISHSLLSTGAIFDIVENGKEVIDCLNNGTYDLIMMDISMPIMDGFEATDYIRNTLKINIPIIAMTGWTSKEKKEKIANGGMNGTLTKPFGLENLYKILYEYLIEEKHPDFILSNSITQPKEVEIEETPPEVDLSMLNELSESDSEYKKTILKMFLDSMPETIKQIEESFAVKDYVSLGKAAHYAKSSLSVINVAELRALVADIELNCKKMVNLDHLEGLVKRVKSKYKLVVVILNEEIKNI